MPLSKLNYVHLESGRFTAGTETSAEDIDTLLDSFFAAPPKEGLFLHFHGGLVSRTAGKEIAEKMVGRFGELAHVVGFVWESGFFETVPNNLKEIAKEELFQRLLIKVMTWALKKWAPGVDGLVGVEGLKGVESGGVVDELAMSARIRAWLETGVSADGRAPYDDVEAEWSIDGDQVAEPLAADVEITADIEQDPQLGEALAKVSNDQLAEPVAVTSKGGAVLGSTSTLMDEDALARLREPAVAGEKGILSTLKLAYYTTKIVYRVIRRMASGRGHGLYTTAVEEILREFYVGAVGTLLFWHPMQKDTIDAFGADPDLCGGTAFLKRLRDRLDAGEKVPRITLCGHSTGAIYICRFLAAAAHWLPDLRFDVIFLAPAVTSQLFAETLAAHRERIRGFRSFAMHDALEKRDRLVQILYPRSLLYFVSGVVESEKEADIPLVGMERFFSGNKPYTGAKMPGVDAVRLFLASDQHFGVWSEAKGTVGQETSSAKHGNFDDDPATLASIRSMLVNGF